DWYVQMPLATIKSNASCMEVPPPQSFGYGGFTNLVSLYKCSGLKTFVDSEYVVSLLSIKCFWDLAPYPTAHATQEPSPPCCPGVGINNTLYPLPDGGGGGGKTIGQPLFITAPGSAGHLSVLSGTPSLS